MIDLSVIIVNFNVKEFLENAIISIKNATRRLKVEIFVVDNGSEDGSCNMVKNKFPDVKLIENKINLGFSKANNIALKLCKGKYVALINPDTIVQEDTFEKLISFMNSSNDIGMAGCKVLNPDGSLQLACRRSFPTPLVAFSRVVGLSKIFPKSRIWGKYNLTYLNPDKITEVDAISGSFMMIKKEVLNKVGLLDESYFLYGEDLDLCYRIKKEGYKIYYYPGTSIIHFKGESTKKTTYEPLKAFYKAMVIFIESHFKGKYLFLPLWLLKAGIHIKEVISLIIKNKTRAFSFILDLIFINVSILLALIIRFGKLVPLPVFFDIRSYFLINSVCSSIWLTLLYFNRIYTRYKFSRLTLSILEGFFVISTITFFFKEYAFSRLVVLYSVVLIFLFLTGWRFLEKLIRKIFTGKSFKMKRAVIVGENLDMNDFITKMENTEYNIVGILNEKSINKKSHFYSSIETGRTEELENFIKKYNITEVLVISKGISYDSIINIISLCYEKRLNVKIVPSELDVFLSGNTGDNFETIPVVDVEYNLNLGYNIFLKRLIDFSFSLIILIILLPFYFISIKFKNLNHKYRFILGLRKEPIYIKELYKNKNYYSGWEQYFPKLLLVLKGELSLTGRSIKEDFPTVKGASLVKPGIIDVMEFYKNRNYLYYAKNYTLFKDLKFLWKKLITVI